MARLSPESPARYDVGGGIRVSDAEVRRGAPVVLQAVAYPLTARAGTRHAVADCLFDATHDVEVGSSSSTVTLSAHAMFPTASLSPPPARTIMQPELSGFRCISVSAIAQAVGVRLFLNIGTYFQP